MGVVSVVCGVFSIFATFYGGIILGVALAIIGLILGFASISNNKVLSISGIVFSIIQILLTLKFFHII